MEKNNAEATVRIYAGRDLVGDGRPGGGAADEVGRDAVRQAALADVAAKNGLEVAFDGDLAHRGRSYVWATGALVQVRPVLEELWRLGFSGYSAETDSEGAEDEISRFHKDVVWDVATLPIVH